MMFKASNLKLSQDRPFNIIEQFSALPPSRKTMLCDYLFLENEIVFQKSVTKLWPEAQSNDIKKLNNFLILLRKSTSNHH